MFGKCLKLEMDHYGVDNIRLVYTYGKIGTLYSDRGMLEQALDIFSKCLDIEKVQYGEDDFKLVDTYLSIGNVYDKASKF